MSLMTWKQALSGSKSLMTSKISYLTLWSTTQVNNYVVVTKCVHMNFHSHGFSFIFLRKVSMNINGILVDLVLKVSWLQIYHIWPYGQPLRSKIMLSRLNVFVWTFVLMIFIYIFREANVKIWGILIDLALKDFINIIFDQIINHSGQQLFQCD